MKKWISIFISLLMLGATMPLTLATHFCCGTEIASKISFIGKPASCGAECNEMEAPSEGINLTVHCCDNILISCQTDNNFTPSFNVIQESGKCNIPAHAVQDVIFCNTASSIPLYTKYPPPGISVSAEVDLASLCVFRI